MLATFAILLIFQCLGEGITFALSLSIPGPVVGMLLLFVALVIFPSLLQQIEKTGSELLSHLSLLFVPAGVGIIVTAATVRGHWLAVIVSVVISTTLTLAVTALAVRWTTPHQVAVKSLPENNVIASDQHDEPGTESYHA